jgi:hypothetical protein
MDQVIPQLVTDVKGKIRNLPDFHNEALTPVFEAVANSIQAIEEIDNITHGDIQVKIIHENSLLETEIEKKIVAFEIIDNGIGFTDENFKSFCTSDSTYKINKGCKGIGRFLWLKAFDAIEVSSVYKDDQKFHARNLKLTINGISYSNPVVSNTEQLQTVIKLVGFHDEYYMQPSAYKTTQKIAQRILEHCLSYYITKQAPIITVFDEEEKIVLNDLYDKICNGISTENINIKKVNFLLHHVKLFSTYNKLHNVVLCADHRDVKRCSMTKLIGTSSQIDTGNERFVYAAYVESKYLDNNVNSTRQDFNFPENRKELLEKIYPISLSEILDAIEEKSKAYLQEYIEKINSEKKKIVDSYLEKENPTLRAVARYCPEVYTEIEPSASNEKIYEILYAYKGKAEYEIKKLGNKLLKTQYNSIDEIKDEIKDLEDKIECFQKDQLSSYMIFRKLIIDLLKKKLDLNTNGEYNNEDIIHDIIFPRKTTTNDILFDDHNLWLIDERLSFHSFAMSDKPIKDIIKNGSSDRPDICVFNEIDIDNVANSVSLIEFKKPGRRNFDINPVAQVLEYVRKIRNNNITNAHGRPIITNGCTKYYCYAICDINAEIIKFVENNNYSVLKNNLGYSNYVRDLNSHVEILAFDKIVADASQRHRIFFEKLNI